MFGVLFLCFESQLKSINKVIIENFGFMFNWIGRALFFVFCGALCFMLNIFGIVVGSITIAVVIFNVFVMCKNPAYFEQIKQDNLRKQIEARGTDATVMGDINKGMELGKVAVTIAKNPVAQAVVSASMTPQPPPGNELDEDPNWEKLKDEGSGQYYYYNKNTQETKWMD